MRLDKCTEWLGRKNINTLYIHLYIYMNVFIESNINCKSEK